MTDRIFMIKFISGLHERISRLLRNQFSHILFNFGEPPITRGIFARLFFQNEDFFWRQIFLKSTDHSTVGESENDHLACTPKRQWILSGRSDQKPNPPKNELD